MKTKCYHCKNASCRASCPFGNDIPKIIQYYENEDYEKAYEILLETSIIPSLVCQVCFGYCKNNCIRRIKDIAIDFQEIEKQITNISKNNYIETLKKVINPKNIKINKNVTIIGSGPSGLSCAIYLALFGVNVTLIEKNKKLGGLLRYGIPDFRLDKKELDFLDEVIEKLNIKTKEQNLLELDLYDLDEIVVIAIGLDKDIQKVKEEDFAGKVINGKKYLEQQTNIDIVGKKICVIGGGNTAIDCARTLKKKGAIPTIVYRRSKEQMPANLVEVEEALCEGVLFLFNTDVEDVKLNDKNNLEIKMYKTTKTKTRNEKTTKIQDSEFVFDADMIANCIGATLSSEIKKYLESYNISLEKKEDKKENKEKEEKENKEKENKEKKEKENKKEKTIYLIGDIAGNIQDVTNASKSGIDIAKKIIKESENVAFFKGD